MVVWRSLGPRPRPHTFVRKPHVEVPRRDPAPRYDYPAPGPPRPLPHCPHQGYLPHHDNVTHCIPTELGLRVMVDEKRALRTSLSSTRKTTTDPHGREGRGELRLYTIVLREAKLPETKPAIINNVTNGTPLGCLFLRRGGRKPTAARLPAGGNPLSDPLWTIRTRRT